MAERASGEGGEHVAEQRVQPVEQQAGDADHPCGEHPDHTHGQHLLLAGQRTLMEAREVFLGASRGCDLRVAHELLRGAGHEHRVIARHGQQLGLHANVGDVGGRGETRNAATHRGQGHGARGEGLDEGGDRPRDRAALAELGGLGIAGEHRDRDARDLAAGGGFVGGGVGDVHGQELDPRRGLGDVREREVCHAGRVRQAVQIVHRIAQLIGEPQRLHRRHPTLRDARGEGGASERFADQPGDRALREALAPGGHVRMVQIEQRRWLRLIRVRPQHDLSAMPKIRREPLGAIGIEHLVESETVAEQRVGPAVGTRLGARRLLTVGAVHLGPGYHGVAMQTPEADPDPIDFDWQRYVAWLVANHGSLAAVAARLAEERGFREDVQSIERGLRRLRGRGARDGGTWGTRCLRAFGLPKGIEGRVRWMGHYHSRFTDLPRSICLDLLRPWERPPIAESPARAWVLLGRASVALRGRFVVEAEEMLDRAEPVAVGPAKAEALLVRAFIDSRRRPERVEQGLDAAEAEVRGLPRDEDRACMWARLVDQRAYQLNVRRKEPEAAEELYAGIPRVGPPFALVRRHNGLGWCALVQGHRDGAIAHARLSVQHAGDAGSLRLRVMALNLLSKAIGGDEGEQIRVRAVLMASRLEDEALRVRLLRSEPE